MPTAIWSLVLRRVLLRSGGAKCDLALAMEVREFALRSEAN